MFDVEGINFILEGVQKHFSESCNAKNSGSPDWWRVSIIWHLPLCFRSFFLLCAVLFCLNVHFFCSYEKQLFLHWLLFLNSCLKYMYVSSRQLKHTFKLIYQDT